MKKVVTLLLIVGFFVVGESLFAADSESRVSTGSHLDKKQLVAEMVKDLVPSSHKDLVARYSVILEKYDTEVLKEVKPKIKNADEALRTRKTFWAFTGDELILQVNQNIFDDLKAAAINKRFNDYFLPPTSIIDPSGQAKDHDEVEKMVQLADLVFEKPGSIDAVQCYQLIMTIQVSVQGKYLDFFKADMNVMLPEKNVSERRDIATRWTEKLLNYLEIAEYIVRPDGDKAQFFREKNWYYTSEMFYRMSKLAPLILDKVSFDPERRFAGIELLADIVNKVTLDRQTTFLDELKSSLNGKSFLARENVIRGRLQQSH